MRNDQFELIVDFDAPSPLDEVRRTALRAGASALIVPDILELRLTIRSADIGVLEVLRQEAITAGGTVVEYPADLIPPPSGPKGDKKK